MADDIRKLNPGDPFRPSAVMHNYVVDLIREHLASSRNPDSIALGGNNLSIKNVSGRALNIHSVVGIGEPAIPPVQSVLPEISQKHLYNKAFNSAAPIASYRFGVTQEPTVIGGLAEAIITGETWVYVNVTNEGHAYAGPSNGDYDKLVSQASPGPVKIIWKETGTGTKWAYVLLDQLGVAAASLSTGNVVHLFANCTIENSDVTVESNSNIPVVTRLDAQRYLFSFSIDFGDKENFTPTGIIGNSDYFYEVKASRTSKSCVMATASGTEPEASFGITVHGIVEDAPIDEPDFGDTVACSVCNGGVAPAYFCFQIPEFESYSCTNCFSATGVLTQDSLGVETCAWSFAVPGVVKPSTSFFCRDMLFVFTNGYAGQPEEDDATWALSVYVGGLLAKIYTTNAAGWTCNTPLELTDIDYAIAGPFYYDRQTHCAGWPEKITVQPGPCSQVPTIAYSDADLAIDATTTTIYGTGFDTDTPSNNVVTFNLGAAGTVTGATSTYLTVTFDTAPTTTGALTAIVVNGNGTSAPAVQVATVVSGGGGGSGATCDDAILLTDGVPVNPVLSASEIRYYYLPLDTGLTYKIDYDLAGSTTIDVYGGDCSGVVGPEVGGAFSSGSITVLSHTGPKVIVIINESSGTSPNEFTVTVL